MCINPKTKHRQGQNNGEKGFFRKTGKAPINYIKCSKVFF